MKKAYFLISIICIVLFGCSETATTTESRVNSMAAAIADSVRNAKELEKWILHFDSLEDKSAELIVRQKYGKVLRDMSDFEAAIRQHDTCIAMAKEQNDTLQLIIALNNQGTNFRRLGDLHEASNNHYAALELCDETEHDTTFVARKNRVRTYNGLGNVMLSLGNDSVAESLFTRALAGETELNSATGQAINLANIGAIKEKQRDTDSARTYYNMSMEKNIETGNPIGISLCHQYLGHLAYKEGKYAEAMKNYRKSLEIGLRTSDVWHWLKPCEAMADIFLEENKTDSARKYINMALEAAIKIKARSHLARVYGQCAKLQEMTGQYNKALLSIKQSQAYKDSTAIEQNQTHVQNLRIKYEVNKRKEEVGRAETEAEFEKTLRKTVMWSSIAVVTLVVIAIASQVRVFKEKQRANHILKKIDKERQEFYRGITHQLKTPLTVVIGMTDQLQKHIPNNEAAQQGFEALKRKSNELLNLVTEMIDYNKGIRKEVNITELSTSTPLPINTESSSEHNLEPSTDYILVAEDDHDVALLITEMLKNEGYEHLWAKDGQEALDIICKSVPKLVITDIMMPRMDGIELIKNIRNDADKKHIPIIVVSARTEDEDRIAGLKAGAEVYLGKPFIPEELLLRIRMILEQREIIREKYFREIADADKKDEEETMSHINDNDTRFLQEVDEFIYENLINSELNANILADKMCISLTTLNRKIKAITSTNTTNYIRLKRLGRAKQLLMNTDMAMGEIQAVCGFESPSYFSRAFKSEYGMSPSEFRKTTNRNS